MSLFALVPLVSMPETVILWSLLLCFFLIFTSPLRFLLFICMSSADHLPSSVPQSPVFERCHKCTTETSQNVFSCVVPPTTIKMVDIPYEYILQNMKILVWKRPHPILPDQMLQVPPTPSALVWWLIITHTFSDAVYLLPGNAQNILSAPANQGQFLFPVISDCPS